MQVVRKFIGYLGTGGIAAVVDVGLYVLLTSLGLQPIAAAPLSFSVAAAVNFALSARLVFATAASFARFRMFFLYALVGLGINSAVTAGAAAVFVWPDAFDKLAGIAVAFGFNFLINLMLVFRK